MTIWGISSPATPSNIRFSRVVQEWRSEETLVRAVMDSLMAWRQLSLADQAKQPAPYRPCFSLVLDRLDRPETVPVIPVSLASGCAGVLPPCSRHLPFYMP